MDQCLHELEDAGEYKTDLLAVQLIRIQRLTEEICNFHSRDPLVDEQLGSPQASMTARLEAFQVELAGLQKALPPKLKSDCTFPNCSTKSCRRCFANVNRDPRPSILLLQ